MHLWARVITARLRQTSVINYCMRSTNPIWRLAPVFVQLGSWNEKNNAGNSRKRRSREEVRGLVDEFEAAD
jgi:hypothetical protein